MSVRFRVLSLAWGVWLGFCAAGPALAQESSITAHDTNRTAAITEASLSPAVAEILKLMRAKIGEDVILAFIQNSEAGFSLSADDIIFLQKEGLSSAVLVAMLNKPAATIASAPDAVIDTSDARLVPDSGYAPSTTPTYYAFDGSRPYWYDTSPYWYGYHYWYDPWPYWSTFTFWAYPFFFTGHGHYHHNHHDGLNAHYSFRRQGAVSYNPNHRHNTAAIHSHSGGLPHDHRQTTANTASRSGSLFSNDRASASRSGTSRSWVTAQRAPVGSIPTRSQSLFSANRSSSMVAPGNRTVTQPLSPRGGSLTTVQRSSPTRGFGSAGGSLFNPRSTASPSVGNMPGSPIGSVRNSTVFGSRSFSAPSAMSAPSAPSAMSAPRMAPAPSGGFRGGGGFHGGSGGSRGAGSGGGSLFGGGRR